MNGDHAPLSHTRRVGQSHRVGVGVASSHHGELLQGAFVQPDGRHRRGLITLPCPLFSSNATVEIDASATALTVVPGWKSKALRAAAMTAEQIGHPGITGRLTIHSDIEVGLGFGSSTSDVTAAIRAVTNAFDASLANEDVARIAVVSESAVDPLMFDDMVLFAHRDGEVIESFDVPLASIGVLGFRLGIGPVDTLKHPPAQYNRQEMRTFHSLLERLRAGLAVGDLTEIGRVASHSARINQRFLPIPGFDTLITIAASLDAAGLQVAHSGNIAGFLFDPSDHDLDHKRKLARKQLTTMGITHSWFYAVDSPPATPRPPDEPCSQDPIRLKD